MTARRGAVAGSLAFLVAAPGVVAGLGPWLLTGWNAAGDVPAPLQAAGAVLAAVGVAVLLEAFARFALHGVGTPAPVAPTAHLVVGGLYRHVRNPMYLAVASIIAGQAAILVPGQATVAPFGRPIAAPGGVLGLARATGTNKSCVLASHGDRLARDAANVT